MKLKNLEWKNTEWKIMCSSHTACPKVKAELSRLGFQKVKDTPNSPTSDISAVCLIENEQKIHETAKELFKACGEDIQQISVDTN